MFSPLKSCHVRVLTGLFLGLKVGGGRGLRGRLSVSVSARRSDVLTASVTSIPEQQTLCLTNSSLENMSRHLIRNPHNFFAAGLNILKARTLHTEHPA